MRATKMSENEKRKSSRRRIGTESKATVARRVNMNFRRRVHNLTLDTRDVPGHTRQAMTMQIFSTARGLHIPVADLGLIAIVVILPH